jgi:hypothetical protein
MRSCSPVADRSTRAEGSSSSIRWSGRAHLVEVGLRLRLDRDRERRDREVERREDDRGFLRGQRVAGLGDGQLRDGADLARGQLADRLLVLAVQEQQPADPLILLAVRVPRVGLAVKRAREDPEVGQPADERVGGGLEDAGDELARRVRGDRRVGAGLRVLRRDRGLLGGGRHVADERVEQGVDADALRGAADEDRGEDRVADAAMEAGVEFRVADLLAFEVLRQDIVVGLRGGLEELVAALRDLVGEAVGDGDLDLRLAVEPVGLAMDEVDVALETLAGADRDVERGNLVAEAAPQRVERGRRVRVLLVALVDEEARRPARRAAQRDPGLEAGLDRPGRVGDEERAVGGREPADDLGDEVRVAGRVDERDPGLVVLERGDREAQRLLALLLLGLVVEVGAPVVDLAEPLDRAGLERAGARRAWSCHRRRDPPGRHF